MKQALTLALSHILFAGLCTPAHAANETLIRLVEAAGPERLLCEKFSADRREAFRKLPGAAPKDLFTSREEAIAALSLFEARPGTGPRTREAAAYFLTHAEELLGTLNPFSDAANLSIAMKNIPECEPLLGLWVLRPFLRSEEKLQLNPSELKRGRLAIAYYLKEARDANLGTLSLAIRTSVLTTYLEEAYRGSDRMKLLTEAKSLEESFEQERRLMRESRGRWLAPWQDYTGRTALREIAWRGRFLAHYEALLAKVFGG